jgi:hypothetical protein
MAIDICQEGAGTRLVNIVEVIGLLNTKRTGTDDKTEREKMFEDSHFLHRQYSFNTEMRKITGNSDIASGD